MYITIEGVIGVGKTSLARLLQESFDARLVLEAFEENPFLSDFYADPERYAFQTQIFFLLSRYRQQREMGGIDLKAETIVADYTFQKDALFAQLNLIGDELETYYQVHRALAERIPTPDLTVYLQVSTDIAMKRITMRDRPYERQMSRAYIERLNQTYDSYFHRSQKMSVLTVDSDTLDFVAHTDHLEQIENRIREALGISPFQPQLPLDGGATP